MSYYVYRMGDRGFDAYKQRVNSLEEAKSLADELRAKTGDHHMVMSIKSVWSTLTLDELVGEDCKPLAIAESR